MSFISFNFAFFLAAGLLVFHLSRPGWRPTGLLVLSFAFYATWGLVHTLLLAAVTTGVYVTAIWIEGRRTEQGKRAVAALGVMLLLILLFAFKAAGWMWEEFGSGSHQGSPAALIIAPLGLSYYLFKMIGYLLNVYW